MLFPNDRFEPGSIADPLTRAILEDACGRAEGRIRPGDLLAAAIRLAGDELAALLSPAVVEPHSWNNVVTAAGPGGEPVVDPLSRGRKDFTPAAARVLDQFAAALSASAGLLDPVALPLLLAFLFDRLAPAERDRFAALDLEKAGRLARQTIGRQFAVSALESLLGGPDQAARASAPPVPPELAPSEDLTERVRIGDAPAEYPFDGEPVYEAVFEAAARALYRRDGGHLLLVGERGVGLATVSAELARRAALGRYPHLVHRRFVLIDARHTPPDESRQRLEALFGRVADQADWVACMDGFAALLRTERGTTNRSALLAAATRSRCRVIGMVSPREYEEFVTGDPEFQELFARVDVPEPELEVAIKLLTHYACGLGRKFDTPIDAEAVRQAVVLTSGYVLHDRLPGKALRVLHRACETADYDRRRAGGPAPVSAEQVVRVVSEITGVPEETLRGVADRTDYERALAEVVFGQERAVRAVATELGLIKAGMTDPGKPASVLLFLGQTGTGKTELAKALARFYSPSKTLKTYALGNCVEPHSVSTIIGVPPGYVGHEQGGRLVAELTADPYGVFLLDETDKAHPDVLQPFLNLFDEGWVTDQRGAKAYADKAIFILTSNVGQRMIADLAREGKSVEEIATRMTDALSQIRHAKSDRPVFTPEFLARLKRVIVFQPLSADALLAVTGKAVADLCSGWRARRGKELVIPDELTRRLAAEAHARNERSGGKEGGRVVRKLLADQIEAPLQRAVAASPSEYRAAARVVLTCPPTHDPIGSDLPAAQVVFESPPAPAP
jgi:ATP-dependent Clp protease ATP-binding subunit ClpA